MDQVKNELSIRKQKITESIDYNISLVKNERKEIDKMMKAEKEYLPEIQEIIKSVDKLCENKF